MPIYILLVTIAGLHPSFLYNVHIQRFLKATPIMLGGRYQMFCLRGSELGLESRAQFWASPWDGSHNLILCLSFYKSWSSSRFGRRVLLASSKKITLPSLFQEDTIQYTYKGSMSRIYYTEYRCLSDAKTCFVKYRHHHWSSQLTSNRWSS